jgi:hypothetical protein
LCRRVGDAITTKAASAVAARNLRWGLPRCPEPHATKRCDRDYVANWAASVSGCPGHGDGEEPATPDVEGLRRFLEGEVLPWFENRKKELANRPLIREQAFGEALDPDKLERLGRYEVHLDRKLERMLTMLLRLKDLRRTAVEG